MTISRQIGFPNRMFTKMRYVENFNSNLAAWTNPYFFRGNSIADPNFTGIGHQPRSHDEWATVYGRYRVTSCKMEIFAKSLSTNISTGRFTIIVKPQATPVAELRTGPTDTFVDAYEMNRFRKLTIDNSQSEGASRKITIKSSTARALGMKTTATTNEDVGADMNANPIKPWYWGVYLSTPAEGFVLSFGTQPLLQMTVRLTYNVVLSNRLVLDES